MCCSQRRTLPLMRDAGGLSLKPNENLQMPCREASSRQNFAIQMFGLIPSYLPLLCPSPPVCISLSGALPPFRDISLVSHLDPFCLLFSWKMLRLTLLRWRGDLTCPFQEQGKVWRSPWEWDSQLDFWKMLWPKGSLSTNYIIGHLCIETAMEIV